MTLKPKRRNTELKVMTTSSMKGACDKAATKVMGEVTFKKCPKCGFNTLGKLGDVEVCINCE